MDTTQIPLSEIIKYLHKDNIIDLDIPTDFINTENDNFSKEGNYIIIKVDCDRCYIIKFNITSRWDIVNSLGDGYYTQNIDYVDDIEVLIDELVISDSTSDRYINTNDSVYLNGVTQWIENIILN